MCMHKRVRVFNVFFRFAEFEFSAIFIAIRLLLLLLRCLICIFQVLFLFVSFFFRCYVTAVYIYCAFNFHEWDKNKSCWYAMTAWLLFNSLYSYSFFSHVRCVLFFNISFFICISLLQIDKVHGIVQRTRCMCALALIFSTFCSNRIEENKMRLLRKNGNNFSTIRKLKQWKASLLSIDLNSLFF